MWNYYNPKFEYEELFQDIDWPWAGHKNFIYDYVRNIKPKTIVELGTHKGTSFFSMCQAVKDANLSTRLFAVDSWKGDRHVGAYGKDIYIGVKTIKNKFYVNQKIALLRCFFDEAISKFKDGTVDLLHIDGEHTYEAVMHDYLSWDKKLSKNAVIIFHDTDEIKTGFGVYKLWSELKSMFSVIEFHHSHGLGVLFLNKKNGTQLKILEASWQKYYPLVYDSIKLRNNFETVQLDLNKMQKKTSITEEKFKSTEKEITSVLDDLNTRNTELISEKRKNRILQKDFDKISNTIKWKIMTKFERLMPSYVKRITFHVALFLWILMKKTRRIYQRKRDILYIKYSNLFDEKWYLRKYPDVAKKKVNPIAHYLDFGAYEGRNPSLKFDNNWYLQQYPDVATVRLNPVVHYMRFGKNANITIKNIDNEEYQNLSHFMFIKKRVSFQIKNAFLIFKFLLFKTSKKSVIIFTHDNFLYDIGGTGKYIYNEVCLLNQNSINVLVVYPVKIVNQIYFNVILNESIFLTQISLPGLLSFLKLCNSRLKLISYNIHHFYHYKVSHISDILSTIKEKKIILLLHDIFFINPQEFFNINPHLDSTTFHDKKKNLDKNLTVVINKLFSASKYIIFPSYFLKALFIKYHKTYKSKLIVEDHLSLEFYKKRASHNNERLRIAYLGYQAGFKGYDVFNSLAQTKSVRDKYYFYAFGNSPQNNVLNNIINVKLGFIREVNAKITTLLLNNKIDIVILWSLLPESYSYTLHEAYSAGIPIITNTISGNIYENISNKKIYGKAFKSQDEMTMFLSNIDNVRKFIANNKNSSIFIPRHNSAFLKLYKNNAI